MNASILDSILLFYCNLQSYYNYKPESLDIDEYFPER